MTIGKVAEGLSILAKYSPESYSVVCEHDEMWAGEGIKVSKEDKKKLKDLGWDFNVDEIESWHTFV